VKEESLAEERITEIGLAGLAGLVTEDGAKGNPDLDCSSGLSGQNTAKPANLPNSSPHDSDSLVWQAAKPVGKPNSSAQLVALARRHGGRLSIEDCTRAGIDRDKAVFLLGMLTDQYGWEKKELVSGLMVWVPPS
jgi:hypothetical protein